MFSVGSIFTHKNNRFIVPIICIGSTLHYLACTTNIFLPEFMLPVLTELHTAKTSLLPEAVACETRPHLLSVGLIAFLLHKLVLTNAWVPVEFCLKKHNL